MAAAQVIFDNSDSDDGEENYLRLLQRNLRDHSNPFDLPSAIFVELFRFPPALMLNICDSIIPHLNESHRSTKIPAHIRILAAIYFFATGSYLRTIGQSVVVNLSQSQVSRCILEVREVICNHLAAVWIKFPDRDEYLSIKEKFMEHNFPGVIAVIDGTHIAITNPGIEIEHTYFNRKHFHSKNVLVICDNNHKILAINARHAGATHDAFVWRSSSIREELQERYEDGDHSSWLLGDSGYNLEPFLMTPVRNAADNSPESRYNSAHRRARSVVERCIGIWKSRFRCILQDRVLKYNPERAGTIINVCAVLHNIAIFHRLPLEQDVEVEEFEIEMAPEEHRDEIAQNIRRNLIRHFV